MNYRWFSVRTLVFFLAAASLAACGAKEDKKVATQAAVRVNGAEITVHQLNQVLTHLPGAGDGNAEQVRKDVLEKLIDQQLVIEQAQSAKLDRQPEVMAAMEAARRDVLTQAYLDQIQSRLKPTQDEARKYYTGHPELFSQRRVFDLQELQLKANDTLLPALRDKVATARTMDEVAGWLKERGENFTAHGGPRPAEQIPLEILPALHALPEGRMAVLAPPQRLVVVRVVASRQVPVDEATALPRIQQFLTGQRSREQFDNEIRALRQKARIEYLGAFAENKAGAPAADASRGVAGIK